MKSNNHSACDTETVEGKVVLICSPQRYKYLPKSFEEIASFLFSIKANESHHIWTYNLTYDATAILKFLIGKKDNTGEDLLKTLYHENKVSYGKYKIMFIPGKFFSISKKGDKATLVDAAQFFNTTLDKAAETFLNDHKINNPVVEEFKNQENKTPDELYKYLEDNKDLMIEYCKKDAALTARLGEKIDESCFKAYRFRLETYTSNAKIGEKATLEYCGKQEYTNNEGKKDKYFLYPRLAAGNAVKAATLSYRGGIFSTWKRGMFEDVTDLDINSAYPYQMQKLPHWGNGSFVEIDDQMLKEIDTKQKYEYGWVLCKFDCPYIPYNSEMKEHFAILYDDKEVDAEVSNLKIYYPIGEREQVITLVEYYFMQKYKFKSDILAGYVWKRKEGEAGHKHKNPFGWITGIYDRKTQIKKEKGKEAKKDMEYLQCKIGMNGAYGKTVQRIGVNKTLYNPFYGSYITAQCRIQIMEFILDNHLENDVISIATDGILLEGKHPELDKLNSEELGKWEVNHYDSCLMLGNGMLQLNDKKGCHSRMRGVTNKQDLDIITILKEIGDKQFWVNGKRRPLHLGEALMHHKIFKIEDMNKFIKFSRKLDVNADDKMKWPIMKDFNELMNKNFSGKRWTVSEIEAMKPKPKP